MATCSLPEPSETDTFDDLLHMREMLGASFPAIGLGWPPEEPTGWRKMVHGRHGARRCHGAAAAFVRDRGGLPPSARARAVTAVGFARSAAGLRPVS